MKCDQVLPNQMCAQMPAARLWPQGTGSLPGKLRWWCMRSAVMHPFTVLGQFCHAMVQPDARQPHHALRRLIKAMLYARVHLAWTGQSYKQTAAGRRTSTSGIVENHPPGIELH